MRFLLVFLFAFATVDAQECSLGEQRIKELSLAMICAEFNSQKNMKSGDSQVTSSDYQKMKQLCEGGASSLRLSAVSGAFTFASEFYLNHILVKKMLPLITDDFVKAFIKNSGMDQKAYASLMGHYGMSEKEALEIMNKAIKKDLAKVLLKDAGYYTFFGGKDIVGFGTLASKDVLANLRVSMVNDEIFQKFMTKGEGPEKAFKKAQKAAGQAVKDYLSSEAFAKEAAPLVEKFKLSLGNAKLPLRAPLRMGAAAMAGFGVQVLLMGGSPTTLGCSHRPSNADKIVKRDPENDCKAIGVITPEVVNGLLHPEITQSILNSDKVACEGYTALYRKYVLHIPDNAENMKVVCTNDIQSIAWEGGNFHGYNVVKEKETKIYFRPQSKSGNKMSSWIEMGTVKNVSENPISRDLNEHCLGSKSVFQNEFHIEQKDIDEVKSKAGAVR
jgi:hypothetical protein